MLIKSTTVPVSSDHLIGVVRVDARLATDQDEVEDVAKDGETEESKQAPGCPATVYHDRESI